jgi:16S rRNA (cytosine967-C5)-methyltransferase
MRVQTGARSDAELGAALARSGLSVEDRALATRLVYGVEAWRQRLDHTIAAYADRSIDRIDMEARVALRLGAYQLLLLDRVPDYAAVDSSVSLLSGDARRSTGFVNAILRRIGREGEAALPNDETEAISVRVSHPVWLVRHWRAELGAENANALMRANNEPAPTTLRCLVDRTEAIATLAENGCHAVPARFATDALTSDRGIALRGIAVPQAEASQLVTLFVGASEGERVLDACAAPGGKAAYLASRVGPSGEVTAVDPGRMAARRIQALLELCGERARIVNERVQDLAPEIAYDAVLVDAPCSGLGTLREHPEIRWRREHADLAGYAARQSEILAAAARHVRVGGRVVYATCTLAKAENDDVADRFLGDHDEFKPDTAGELDPAVAPFVDQHCRLRTSPHEHGLSGFFAARFVRIA